MTTELKYQWSVLNRTLANLFKAPLSPEEMEFSASSHKELSLEVFGYWGAAEWIPFSWAQRAVMELMELGRSPAEAEHDVIQHIREQQVRVLPDAMVNDAYIHAAVKRASLSTKINNGIAVSMHEIETANRMAQCLPHRPETEWDFSVIFGDAS